MKTKILKRINLQRNIMDNYSIHRNNLQSTKFVLIFNSMNNIEHEHDKIREKMHEMVHDHKHVRCILQKHVQILVHVHCTGMYEYVQNCILYNTYIIMTMQKNLKLK